MRKKRLIFCCVCLVGLLIISGCGKDKMDGNNASDERVTRAIKVLEESWSEYYGEQKWNNEGYKVDEKYLEIINTQIIDIKDKIEYEKFAQQTEIFKKVDYIVEFDIVSNMYGTAPYYTNSSQNNCVIVYKDGTSKIGNNPFNVYRASTYSTDFTHIIESIEKFHGEYDRVIKIQ